MKFYRTPPGHSECYNIIQISKKIEGFSPKFGSWDASSSILMTIIDILKIKKNKKARQREQNIEKDT